MTKVPNLMKTKMMAGPIYSIKKCLSGPYHVLHTVLSNGDM